MPRNAQFSSPNHEPLANHTSFHLKHEQVTGPFSFLNPTRAHFKHVGNKSNGAATASGAETSTNGEQDPAEGNGVLADDVEFKWRSRDNRKGRHTLVVEKPDDKKHAKYITPPQTNSFRGALAGIWRMCTQYPYWDVSYLVAFIFTWGSIIWVINSFFVWLPMVRPSTEFNNEIYIGGGVTAFIGATVFEIGSVLLMIEAINENRSGCFGWAIEQALSGENERGFIMRLVPDKRHCRHHHQNKKNFVGKAAASARSSGEDNDGKGSADDSQGQNWVWFPSWHELTHHYLREMGFLASLSQFIGATIFWIAGFTGLPGIINHLSPGLEDGVYWTPQVVGGTGFIISGTLFMLETQPNWYTPAFGVLGWHIGFWNLVGAIGFTLCGALGYSTNSGAEFESSLATFWGSWAFLIGSAIQWYESLDKHPVEVEEK